jgi:leader peptidase (prepilin peptidase) / N-methyltransferase
MLTDFNLLPPAYWIVSLALFGLAIGSFLNVVIYRLPREESVVAPSSHCGACDTPIRPYDNVPLVSYALLLGRCRACRARISPRYPLVEALTGCLFVGAYLAGARGADLLADCVFVALIVPLIFIDADVMLLPNKITHPGLLFALVARGLIPNLYGIRPERFGLGWYLGLGDSPDWYVSLVGAAAGGALGGGGLLLLGWLWKVLRGHWGMGLGDVSMMCMVGAYLGWQLTLLTIMLASLIGSVVGISYALARGRDLQLAMPFGIFLGAGALVALLAGERIVNWYLGPLGGF